MSSIELKKATPRNATCAGIGLVSLDVILNGSPLTTPKFSTGGTCGNILLILAYLGWKSHPIARLKLNTSSDFIIKEFETYNADTTGITQTVDGSTPIIIHRVLKDKIGNAKHHFEFRIPKTTQYLPSFKAVVGKAVEGLANNLPALRVLIVDRATRSSIDLAKHCSEQNTLIFFEPSSIPEERLFLELMEYVHVVKFSSERIKNYRGYFPERKALVEIETHGQEGVLYRCFTSKAVGWKKQKSIAIDNVVDSAGAGDWCSAGILHSLGQNGLNGLKALKQKEIDAAIQIGQALGGISCEHLGARGMMRNFTIKQLKARLQSSLSKKMAEKLMVGNCFTTSATEFDFESLL